jgi:hypothetical protein
VLPPSRARFRPLKRMRSQAPLLAVEPGSRATKAISIPAVGAFSLVSLGKAPGPAVRRHSAGRLNQAQLRVTVLKRYHSEPCPAGQTVLRPAGAPRAIPLRLNPRPE